MHQTQVMKEEGWRSVENENENGNLIVSLDLARRSLLSTRVSLTVTQSGKQGQEKKFKINHQIIVVGIFVVFHFLTSGFHSGHKALIPATVYCEWTEK